MIRILAPLACPGRTIESSFAGVLVVAAHRALGLLANLPDPAAPASCRLLRGKAPAPGKSHAEDKPGAARFKSAETDVHDHSHNMFPRVPPATLAFLTPRACSDRDAPYPSRESLRPSKRTVNNKLTRRWPKPWAPGGCLFISVLHFITLFSCIRSETALSFRFELSSNQSGFAMDTDPQREAGSRLHGGAPYRHADSEIESAKTQSADLPAANSRLSTIREMARDFEVSIRTLRFYEDRGLLHPRRENTNRRYDARDRLHLKMILKGKQLGFTLSEIRDILACRGEDSGKTELEMGLLPEQISAQISYLERQRSQIDAAIDTLREAHRRLHEDPRQRGGLTERPGN